MDTGETRRRIARHIIVLIINTPPLVHFAGGTNDNANDAQKEILMTFDVSKATLKKALTDDDLESAIYRNGEERLAANCGDEDGYIMSRKVSKMDM